MKSRAACFMIVLAGLAIAVTGCGRRGDLETPTAAAAESRGEEAPADPLPPPQRSFILDGLIE